MTGVLSRGVAKALGTSWRWKGAPIGVRGCCWTPWDEHMAGRGWLAGAKVLGDPGTSMATRPGHSPQWPHPAPPFPLIGVCVSPTSGELGLQEADRFSLLPGNCESCWLLLGAGWGGLRREDRLSGMGRG